MTRFRLPLIAALLFGAVQLAHAEAPAPAPKTKVVMQLSEENQTKWNMVLANARNLQRGLGADKVDIEVVVYGPGIGFLKADSPLASKVREESAEGILFSACENTMANQHLRKEEMNPVAGYVPSGVIAIVQRQQAGYAYLRP